MTKNYRQYCVVAMAAFMLALPIGVRANAVTDRNLIAVQATVTGTRPGATGFLDVAIVQLAVYDAAQAIERSYRPYCSDIPGASGRTDAAVAKAAHDVLVNRFPAQTAALDLTYTNYLTAHGILTTDLGIPVGASAAGCMITLRANDGSFPATFPPFTGGTDPGVWRPTLPAFAPMVAPWMASVTPFTMR